MSNQKLNVGLVGIGLETYWGQFEGLKPTLISFLDIVKKNIETFQVEVLNLGLVDTYESALEAGRRCRIQDIDLLFLHVGTYAVSSTVLPILQRSKIPVVILNLSPQDAIDYASFNKLPSREHMTGEWLKYCNACPVPEIANVLRRANIPFHQVTGKLMGNDRCWEEIKEWIDASRVAKVMFYNRLGAMGTYYGGMLDIYTDLTKQLITFGGHIEILEIDELTELRKLVSKDEAMQKVQAFKSAFEVGANCSSVELLRAAYTSIALDQLTEKYRLGSLAYFHKGITGTENENTITSIILGCTLLTARNIPVAGEYEIKNVQAMKILDELGAGGSFTEYYAMDFIDDVVIMGHDGPAHFQIGEGKTKVRPLETYHGKVGNGLSVEMQVKLGPVTLLSVVEGLDGNLFLLVAEAESVPGPVLEIGNTNSRYRFELGAVGFVEAWNSYGPAHHCAIGVGHHWKTIDKLGKILGINTVKVC